MNNISTVAIATRVPLETFVAIKRRCDRRNKTRECETDREWKPSDYIKWAVDQQVERKR